MKKLFLLTTVGILAASCSSSDDRDAAEITNPSASVATHDVQSFNANAKTNTFTLYNLRDNKEVDSTQINTDKWDIGFNKTTIIINGGSARKGKGGAAIVKGAFDEVTKVADNTEFKVDNGNTNPNLAITTGSGKGWYTYNMDTHAILPTAGNIILVKTADGKYAKVQIKSYYQGAPTTPAMTDVSGYYTFKYALQTDGSTVFSK
ncbi:HmuY family protein [Elizabethkingia sp. JS20170427COW]|uniref:HmuY family protein n=1 Tax=Elizabethkingia sp. JS20170427COW TaxID=2583851 RepID=UPI0011103D6E|nr:HmuY family protein [Elizabethkingia sp. JS20170427COW]QCX53080.1 hypothetical protein FGE20_04700 [Elizabethkingia sp. JS20170427COW]